MQTPTCQAQSLKAVPRPPAFSFAFKSNAAAAFSFGVPEAKAATVGVQMLKIYSVG